MSAVMSDDSTSSSTTTNILVLSNILYPVIQQLEKSNPKDTPTNLRSLFCNLEETYPGFAQHFIQSFIDKEVPTLSTSKNVKEITLRLEKYCDKTSYLLLPSSAEDRFIEFNRCAKNLKFMLSHIPDEIDEKRIFLERIKEIASAIKKSLDSVSVIHQNLSNLEHRQTVENQKKEFIRASKQFSNILKAYFQDNQAEAVYSAANVLLVQTDYLLRSVKTVVEIGTVDSSLYPLYNQYYKNLKQQNPNRPLSSASMSNNQHLPLKQRSTSEKDQKFNSERD